MLTSFYFSLYLCIPKSLIIKIMKRKEYEKPTMQIVELKQTGMLMTSGFEATRSNYGDAEELDWE